jgi:glutamate racemase
MPKIGVFDSGIGGEAIAVALRRALPHAEIITKSDTKHVPYGDKTPQQVLSFVLPLLEELVAVGCDIIVVACNTVTTHHIKTLRERIPVPLVGIEPMLKPASVLTKSGIIAVCATPATLASPRYAELKQLYAKDITVFEPDCSAWAYMIEHNNVNVQRIREQIETLCDAGVDVIVLGCTHYIWIAQLIEEMAQGRAIVLQPEEAIIRRVEQLLDL